MVDIKNINAAGTTLRAHQLKMFEMLVYIDRICRDNNIKYWLSGGTLLGAIRHKGFIPWDDDLDILFMKKDLKRIHKILKNIDNDLYVLQSNQTDLYYVAPYEKLRLKGTQVFENNYSDYQYRYRGIYIDLFYLEPAIVLFHKISDFVQTRLIKLTLIKSDLWGMKPWFVSSFAYILQYLFYPLMSFLSLILDKKSISYPLGSYFHTQFNKEDFSSSIEVEFEGKLFFAPRNYDMVLRAQYGDYWQLPPLEKIKYHTYSVNFNVTDR